MQLPGIFVESVDLADEHDRAQWAEWYDATYLEPRTDQSGVTAARRFSRISESVQSLVVYELEDVTLPIFAGWQGVGREADVGASLPERLRSAVTGHDVDLYTQIFSTIGDGYRPPATEILHGAFFEAELSDWDEFNDWYNLEHVLFVDEIEGYENCRRFQSLMETTRFLALYDVTSLEVAESRETAAANESAWSDRVRAKLVTYRERRLFDVERVEGAANSSDAVPEEEAHARLEPRPG